MRAIASQITSLTIVYPGADQRKHQSSALLTFVWGIHRKRVNSPHKWPVTRKCFHLMTSSCASRLSRPSALFLMPSWRLSLRPLWKDVPNASKQLTLKSPSRWELNTFSRAILKSWFEGVFKSSKHRISNHVQRLVFNTFSDVISKLIMQMFWRLFSRYL